MENSEIIKEKIRKLELELQAELIKEGKADVLTEVKRRLLEKVPGCQFVDYILWPLRVREGKVVTTVNGVRKYMRWDERAIDMLKDRRFAELNEMGYTDYSISSALRRLRHKGDANV